MSFVLSWLKQQTRTLAGKLGLSSALLVFGYFIWRRLKGQQTAFKLPSQALDQYDYIVVGAGSAGCALAARLAEKSNSTVLLLESGGNTLEATNVKMPLACGSLQLTNFDWQFQTEPQVGALNHHIENRSRWPRGKGLGGCSAINYMVYVRGNPEDYDKFEEMGCEGWGWKNVLPYFVRSERCLIERPTIKNSAYRGKNGNLCVSEMKEPHILSHTFVEAAAEIGIKKNEDYNNPDDQLGASLFQVTHVNGERCSSARAYLTPQLLAKGNLHVMPHCHTLRIIINENKEAVGVEYQPVKDGPEGSIIPVGPKKTALAKKEVIVCAGAVQSPQILMLSGVGPAEELKKHNIPVVVDLPGVGNNLRDHIMYPISYASNIPSLGEHTKTAINLMKYFLLRKGPFVNSNLEGNAFVQTGVRPDLGKRPDLQLLFVASCGTGKHEPQFGGDSRFAYTEEELKTRPQNGWIGLPLLLHPESTGFVKLRDNNPYSPPIIDPRYLSHPRDVQTLVEGGKIVSKLAETKALGKLTVGKIKEAAAAKNPHPEKTDGYYEHMLRGSTLTVYHPCGTCSMGPIGDPKTVVDPLLRVVGVKNLRVADCSIFPTMVSGNTNAPAMMVGEKCADFILQSPTATAQPAPSSKKINSNL